MLTLLAKIGVTALVTTAMALGNLGQPLQREEAVSSHPLYQGDTSIEGYDDLGAE